MGAMGRTLAGCSVEERDRVISASEWGCAGDIVATSFAAQDGLVFGCLMEHIHGGNNAAHRAGQFMQIGPIYDRACRLFGKERVVRALKLRCARLNGSDSEAVRRLIDAGSAVRVEVVG